MFRFSKLVQLITVSLFAMGCADSAESIGSIDAQAGSTAIVSSSNKEKLNEQQVLALLKLRMPQYEFISAKPSPVAGVYTVKAQNISQNIYVSADGVYLFTGKLLQMADTGMVDVQDEEEKPLRLAKLKALPDSDSITFKAKNEQAAVWVFTDVNCGYCQRFHSTMDQLNDLGITVNYLPYPVIGKESMPMMNWAWCEENRQQALGRLKNKQVSASEYKHADCSNSPINKLYNLGVELGVTGTPAIFLPDGTRIPGAVAPEDLAKQLGLK